MYSIVHTNGTPLTISSITVFSFSKCYGTSTWSRTLGQSNGTPIDNLCPLTNKYVYTDKYGIISYVAKSSI